MSIAGLGLGSSIGNIGNASQSATAAGNGNTGQSGTTNQGTISIVLLVSDAEGANDLKKIELAMKKIADETVANKLLSQIVSTNDAVNNTTTIELGAADTGTTGGDAGNSNNNSNNNSNSGSNSAAPALNTLV